MLAEPFAETNARSRNRHCKYAMHILGYFGAARTALGIVAQRHYRRYTRGIRPLASLPSRPMPTRPPNWNDLRIFLEVSRAKTLAGAAQKLKVDHSTISRHIAQLEIAIDAPVFERDHHGFRITARGKELLEHVEAMEASALLLSDVIDGSHGTPTGTVRIATMEGIASLYLATEFIRFKTLQPQIKIELVTSTQLVHVNLREADLFISFFPPQGNGVDVAPVGAFPLHLYAAPAYLQAHGTPERLEELERHQFVSYVDDLIQLSTVRWLQEAVPRPNIAFRSSSMIAQLFSAVDGGGIAMLPSFARAERFGLVRLLSDQVEVKRTIWLTMRRDLRYIPRIKAVTAFLQDAFERDCPLPPGVTS
jgi:DNA-binding transcriptional LysR family regulator